MAKGTGKGVRIAVIDSGIETDHPDLVGISLLHDLHVVDAGAPRDGLRPEKLVFLSPMAQPTELTMVFAATLGFGERIRTGMTRRVGELAGVHICGSESLRSFVKMLEDARVANGWSMQDVVDMHMTGEHCGVIGKQPDVIEGLKKYVEQ